MEKFLKPNGQTLLGSLYAFLVSCVALPLFLRFRHIPFRPVFIVASSVVMLLFALYLIYGYGYLTYRFLLRNGGVKMMLLKYPTNAEIFRTVNISLSAFFSICLGVFEYSLAFSERSFFFLSLAVVHVLLAASKFYLLIRTRSLFNHPENIYMYLGIFFFFISLAIGGITAVLNHVDGAFAHSQFVCIGLAILSSILVIGAIVGTIQARKRKDEASSFFFKVKHVHLIYSIFALVVSFINSYSTNDLIKQRIIYAIGGIASLAILAFSLSALYSYAKRAKK